MCPEDEADPRPPTKDDLRTDVDAEDDAEADAEELAANADEMAGTGK